MKKFEYKLMKTDAKGILGGKVNVEELEYELNQLGQQGWELMENIGMNQDYGSTRYLISVFKREI
ncbi:DUF4177 domain-containing protein [Miniphocaeibacter halophilus]|uniref:DUF4177 domain-containing protein n=1 Tax=Miniphocaeibacter halophilus TaxID=2931922 RepID=A0AC61MT73_9FIRM|nr:DUF4177 domain-containing protein [Miniphocaeibacter halophilus]QQK08802.1 DUF4177 domain-containing protein [Miniphocaeibacter halophilus]